MKNSMPLSLIRSPIDVRVAPAHQTMPVPRHRRWVRHISVFPPNITAIGYFHLIGDPKVSTGWEIKRGPCAFVLCAGVYFAGNLVAITRLETNTHSLGVCNKLWVLTFHFPGCIRPAWPSQNHSDCSHSLFWIKTHECFPATAGQVIISVTLPFLNTSSNSLCASRLFMPVSL